jgi:hypothetical protein
MADITSPVATCPVCWKPLADLPAILRQGDEYVHANCWTGEEPVEKATAAVEPTTEQTQGGDRAA